MFNFTAIVAVYGEVNTSHVDATVRPENSDNIFLHRTSQRASTPQAQNDDYREGMKNASESRHTPLVPRYIPCDDNRVVT